MAEKTKNYPDPVLLGVSAILIVFGVLVLSSVSSTLSIERFGDPFYFLKHQILKGLIPALIFGFLAFKINIKIFKQYAFALFLINLLLVGMVLIPGLGVRYGGAVRWFDLKIFLFQPSEFLKLTFILYLAALMESKVRSNIVPEKILLSRKSKAVSKQDWRSSIPNLAIFITLFGLVGLFLIKQPDLSTFSIIAFTTIIVYFIANTPFWHSVFLVLLGAGGFWFLITKMPYAAARITVFLNQNFDPLGKGYQIKQAMIAIGSGGIWGLGYGMSRQKFGFLPEAMSDTIFSIISEEMGFIGGVFLILCFLIFLWRGLGIAKKSPDKFSQLVATGITIWIVFQAFLNIGSIIRVMPPTGVPLPFISYGGSHLLIEFIALGVLLNISKNRKIV